MTPAVMKYRKECSFTCPGLSVCEVIFSDLIESMLLFFADSRVLLLVHLNVRLSTILEKPFM